jgi:hypothetical protein
MSDDKPNPAAPGTAPAHQALEPYIGFLPTLARTIARAPGTYAMGAAGAVMLGAIVSIIVYVLLFDGKVLKDLAEPSNARGIITFIISISAIGVALILILYSLFGTQKSEQYRQAREVYVGLMGILGTIVGFYFGSADKATPQLGLGEPRLLGKELVLQATGGSPPYHFHASPDSLCDSASRGERVSRDGWIQIRLKSDRPDTLALRVEVFDAKGVQSSRDLVPVKAVPAPAAAARPGSAPAGSSAPAGGTHPPKP